jgi:hypothetical protein
MPQLRAWRSGSAALGSEHFGSSLYSRPGRGPCFSIVRKEFASTTVETSGRPTHTVVMPGGKFPEFVWALF